jgi:hypothetical protein
MVPAALLSAPEILSPMVGCAVAAVGYGNTVRYRVYLTPYRIHPRTCRVKMIVEIPPGYEALCVSGF